MKKASLPSNWESSRPTMFIGISGWMDTEIMWKRGVTYVAFGPIGMGSHAVVECVQLDSVIVSAMIYERQ